MRTLWILLSFMFVVTSACAQNTETSLGAMGNHLGETHQSVEGRLLKRGLEKVRFVWVVSNQEKGLVVGQTPKADSPLIKSSRVVLRVSHGPSRLKFDGKTEKEPVAEGDSVTFVVYAILQIGALLLLLLGLYYLRKASLEKKMAIKEQAELRDKLE